MTVRRYLLLGNSSLLIFAATCPFDYIVGDLADDAGIGGQMDRGIDLVVHALQQIVNIVKPVLHAVVDLDDLAHPLFVLLHHLFNSGVLIQVRWHHSPPVHLTI